MGAPPRAAFETSSARAGDPSTCTISMKKILFLRFYAQDFESATRKRILRARKQLRRRKPLKIRNAKGVSETTQRKMQNPNAVVHPQSSKPPQHTRRESA
jgi:hypothetical protein